jgi:DNA-binding NarL/FixJ family response regulator
VIRVLLSVPSPALRAGLRSLLSSDETINIVNDSLEDNTEADVTIKSASMISMDDSASGGILLLSDEHVNIQKMMRSNHAWGILPSDASAEELIAAVHALSQGLVVGAPALLFRSEGELLEQSPLTERESQVLELLARGLANKQIGLSLGISEHTVKFHVSSIYTKMGVTNRTEAVREGLRGGWIAL